MGVSHRRNCWLAMECQLPTKQTKTQVTERSVDDFLAAIPTDTKRSDAMALCETMARASGEEPRMWGPGIIGFGLNRYRYESGREGEICKIGFSPRREALVLYGLGVQDNPLLEGLGKHTTGKGCLYIKRLSDVNLPVLATMIEWAWNRRSAPGG